MKTNGRSLSARQVTLMVLGYGIGGGILTLPSLAAGGFGASRWLGGFFLGPVFLCATWVVGRVGEKISEGTII